MGANDGSSNEETLHSNMDVHWIVGNNWPWNFFMGQRCYGKYFFMDGVFYPRGNTRRMRFYMHGHKEKKMRAIFSFYFMFVLYILGVISAERAAFISGFSMELADVTKNIISLAFEWIGKDTVLISLVFVSIFFFLAITITAYKVGEADERESRIQ
jgi:hypothetical protein